MVRPMKWHIYNLADDSILMWDDKILEFDNESDADEFMCELESTDSEFSNIRCYFKYDMVYNDGDYINATNLGCRWNMESQAVELYDVKTEEVVYAAD